MNGLPSSTSCTNQRTRPRMTRLMSRQYFTRRASMAMRADERIAYGQLVEILRILHDAKIARMALVTNPEK